ncbi:MAG: LysR substrate-binding domain-containing protein [Streptosporangiales bacterium]
MNIERLRALHAIATYGSVSAAASALHLTASAVSQQVAKLERDVGQRLIQHHGRGVRLTDDGALLAEHAERILCQVEAARADLEAQRGAVRGRVTVAAFASAARGIVPRALRELRDAYPELVVELRELELDESIPMTSRGDVDVAVVVDWDTAPLSLPDNFAKTSLVEDAFDIVLPAGHPLATRESVDLGELADEQWIGWTKDSIYYKWLVGTMRAKGIEPAIAHTAEEHPTHMALVAAGLGIAMLPRIGRTPPTAGVAVVGMRPRLARHTYAVWRSDVGARPAIHAVVTALREAATHAGGSGAVHDEVPKSRHGEQRREPAVPTDQAERHEQPRREPDDTAEHGHRGERG